MSRKTYLLISVIAIFAFIGYIFLSTLLSWQDFGSLTSWLWMMFTPVLLLNLLALYKALKYKDENYARGMIFLVAYALLLLGGMFIVIWIAVPSIIIIAMYVDAIISSTKKKDS